MSTGATSVRFQNRSIKSAAIPSLDSHVFAHCDYQVDTERKDQQDISVALPAENKKLCGLVVTETHCMMTESLFV